jgi:hypothetical protein
MRKSAVDAAFYHLPVLLLHRIAAGAGSKVIKRTITEQTVKLVQSLMTWIKFAFLIGEKSA